MTEIKTHYVPQRIGELMDHLAMMMLSSPQFHDQTGLLPDASIDTVFAELNGGIEIIRKKVGEENYAKLLEISARMRAHFEADPEDKTEDGIKGRECIHEIEDILRAANRRKR